MGPWRGGHGNSPKVHGGHRIAISASMGPWRGGHGNERSGVAATRS